MQLLRRYFLLTVIGFFLLGWAVTFITPFDYPKIAPINFSPKIRKTVQTEIEELNPEILLLGNSVLEEGIDRDLFEKITKKTTIKVSEQGATSAYYYLMIKNNVITAKNPPKYLLLFFLDNLLTRPNFAVTGDYQIILDEIAGDNEQVLVQKAYLNQQNTLEGYFYNHYPIFGERQTVNNAIIDLLKYRLPHLFINCNKVCLDTSLNSAFRYSKMLPVNTQLDLDDVPSKNEEWEFGDHVQQSFLPDIIQMTRERGIELILIREKNHNISSIADESSRSRDYYQDMNEYLKTQGVPLLNFAYEPALRQDDYFFDISHLSKSGREVFTRLVAHKFLELINQK